MAKEKLEEPKFIGKSEDFGELDKLDHGKMVESSAPPVQEQSSSQSR